MTPSLSDISSARSIAQSFLSFLQSSPSPYHAVKNLTNILSTSIQPLTHLSLTCDWKLNPGSTYTLCKGGFMATFHIGKDFNSTKGSFNIIASHSDSPCLKLSYNHSSKDKGLYLASVQCYGSGLWNTWLDRGLGFAGKVIIKSNNTLEERLINVSKPIFYIPNLAIHLRKSDERLNFPLDLEKHFKPIVSSDVFKSYDDCPPLLSYIADQLGVRHEDIINFDLCLVDTHLPELGGINDEFIHSGRLDNLGSCYLTLHGFIQALNDKTSQDTSSLNESITILFHYNYEEIGSRSAEGALSCITVDILKRILLSLGYNESLIMSIFARSFITSVDMSHAVHPLYSDRHQLEHQPQLHKGVVIKSHPNFNYITDLKSTSLFQLLGQLSNVPIQYYRVPNNSACGSTVGPFLSSRLGCDGIDIGICQFAMHSIREICGIMDLHYLSKFTCAIINHLPRLLNVQN